MDGVGDVEQALNQFAHGKPQLTIQDGDYMTVLPSAAISGDNPVTFEWETPSWTDLSNTWVNVTIRLLQEDGKAIKKDDKVSTISLPALTVWQALRLFIGGTLVETVNDYPYAAYVYTLLSASQAAQNTILKAAGLHEQDPVNWTLAINPSFAALQARFAESSPVALTARLCGGIFDCRTYLPGDTKIRLELHQNPAKIFVMNLGTDKVKYEIMKCTLAVRTLSVTPNLRVALMQRLQQTPLVMPVNRTLVRTALLPKGSQTLSNTVIARGSEPTRVFAVLLDADNYYGKTNRNCLGFLNYSIQSAGLVVNGRTVPGNARLDKCDFDKGDGLALYRRLFTAVQGRNDGVALSSITYENFKNIQCVLAFDNSITGSHLQQPERSGTTSLFIDFGVPLGQQTIVLCLIEQQTNLTLDANRCPLWDPPEL